MSILQLVIASAIERTNRRLMILVGLVVIISIPSSHAQEDQKIELTLQKAINIAQDSSLRAFIDKNEYLSDYWDFRTYKAQFLPTLRLSTEPFNFDRRVREEYNSTDSSYEFIQQESINSYANLSLEQNIPFTGGKVYIDSDIGRLQNLGNGNAQYSSTPIRIGIRQSLFDFNWLKWEKKEEPIEFERAKKEYIQSSQEIAEETVDHYFNLLLAQINMEIAKNNYANADTLYRDGKEKYKKDSISKEDMYSLELSLMDAKSGIEDAKTWLKRAETRLLSHLRLDKDITIELIAPDDIPQFNINDSLALAKAKKNNPGWLWYKLRRIDANKDVARAKKSRFKAHLNLSFGMNERADKFTNVYEDPVNQQQVELSMNIPIVDWGLSEKRYNLARKDREVTMAKMEQNEIDFSQNVRRTVEEFNLQKKAVERGAKKDTLAKEMYKITKKKFIEGDIDITKINSAENKKNSFRKGYIRELENYWEYYYEIRQLTLYDFEENADISIEFSNLHNSKGLLVRSNN